MNAIAGTGRALCACMLALLVGACATTPRTLRTPGPPAARVAPRAPEAAARARAGLVRNATAMLGQPYRYGGAAPGGFDCSGLVVYAAARAGLHLPRTTHELIEAGVPVARGEIRAGDLVFMHLSRKELHVGIAIDGGRFVHAPATGRVVRIDSLAASPYARGYLSARRIIETEAGSEPGS